MTAAHTSAEEVSAPVHSSIFGRVSMRFLAFALALAVGVRLLCLLLIKFGHVGGDAQGYVESGRALAEHGIYSASTSAPFLPTAYRPPGYSVFIGAVFSIFGESDGAVQVAQVVLSLCTIVLGVAIAARLRPGTERIACVLLALSPFDAVYSLAFLSETLTTFVLVASAASFALLRGARRVVVGALLLGVLCLVRDIYMAMILCGAAAVIVFRSAGSYRASLRWAALSVVVSVLVITPWTIRNRIQFGKTIPVSAGRLGFSLWLGTWARNGDFTAGDAAGARVYPPEAYEDENERALVTQAGTDVAAAEPIFKRLFAEHLKKHPIKVVTTWLVRIPKLWFGTRFDLFNFRSDWLPRGSPQWMFVKLALFGFNALLFVFGLAGAVITRRRREQAVWLLFPIAFTTAVYLPLNSFEIRYSQPALPFVNLLAAIAVSAVLVAVQRRRSANAAPRLSGPAST